MATINVLVWFSFLERTVWNLRRPDPRSLPSLRSTRKRKPGNCKRNENCLRNTWLQPEPFLTRRNVRRSRWASVFSWSADTYWHEIWQDMSWNLNPTLSISEGAEAAAELPAGGVEEEGESLGLHAQPTTSADWFPESREQFSEGRGAQLLISKFKRLKSKFSFTPIYDLPPCLAHELVM